MVGRTTNLSIAAQQHRRRVNLDEYTNTTGTIAVIRNDYRLPCALGMVCEGNKEASCDDVRQLFNVTLGMGDIMAGIYCPHDKTYMTNCPVGYYCEDSKTKKLCPAGMFCPHKTLVPEIKCKDCLEGATELKREYIGYFVVLIVLAVVVVYFVISTIRRIWLDQVYKLDQIQKRSLDPFKKLNFLNQRKEKIERIKPILETVAQRMEENKIGTAKVKNDLLRIPEEDNAQFHSQALRALFNALDKDESGSLSYSEFNTLLGMNHIQLEQFVGRMNQRAGLEFDTSVLARAVFVKHFLPVLEECSHFNPTAETAAKLFDEMARYEGHDPKRGEEEIRFETFRESDFFHFLSQQQTNDLMKRFRWHRTQQKAAAARSSTMRLSLAQRRASYISGAIIKGDQNLRDGLTIGREEFVNNYPKLLNEVVSTNATRDSYGGGPEYADEEEEVLEVDITFENLSLFIELASKRAPIVDCVTGRLRARTMTALMGGSGAGKTSLLNALCGRAFYGVVEGTIYINGHETSIDKHKDLVGFVPQDDTVYAELTVRENLIYSGRFRLPRFTNFIDIEDYADSTLAKLGLARVANTIVGDVTRRGVSGGEKKRVNIGVELMGKPNVIFLDEPTSGLDASSALMVMGSLKKLVDTTGVTVCAVIHQPRKVIFDMFDSLVLLSVGGKMVYHGPVDIAQHYFESNLGYRLPEGESLADWLIDISSGQLAPDDTYGENTSGNQKRGAMNKAKSTREVGGGGLEEEEGDVHTLRRDELSRAWREYFDKKNKKITKATRNQLYNKPHRTRLPDSSEFIKPTFFEQLAVQLGRALKVGQRNYFYKLIDCAIIVIGGVAISFMAGVTELTIDQDPAGIRLEYLVEELPTKLLNWTDVNGDAGEGHEFFGKMFAFAAGANENFQQYGLMVGVILAVVVGLTAPKVMTEKRIEFYREAGAGYNVNAYYLAMNIVTTVEYSLQLLLVGAVAYWLRHSIVSQASYYVAFLMLSWLCVSWALLLGVIVSPNNVTIVVGAFMAVTGLVFGGSTPPILYEDIYDSPIYALVCGFLSPTRYFTEMMAVGEQRSLPVQTGFTQVYAPNLPQENTTFAIIGLAQNDSGVIVRSEGGWFWSVLPALMVGITIRVAGLGAIHAFGRSQQAKKSLWKMMVEEVRSDMPKKTVLAVVLYLIFFLGLVTVSAWLILRKV